MVERYERKWLWYFTLVVIVLTTFAYVIGYQRAGADWRFTGFLFGVEDGNSYIAKMLIGATGSWLFRTPYTPYPQQGSLVYFPFIILGKLASAPGQHEQLVALYHLFRMVGIALFVFASYDFCALFIQSVRWRRWATVLAVFGGGTGWLSVLGLKALWGQNIPLDFYSPEAFGFLMVYGLPHLAWARAFLLWGLRDYLLPHPAWGIRKKILRIGLIWLGAGLMQPIVVLVGWAVMAAHIAITGFWQLQQQWTGRTADWIQWKRFLVRAFWTGLLSAPLVLYTFISFQLDPFMRGWQDQNRILSPVFTHYLLAYGLLLPFAVLGITPLLKQHQWKAWLVIIWVAIFPLLIYLPINVQRRLVDGAWLALIILALKWVETSPGMIQKWAPRWLSLSFLSTIVLLLGAGITVWTPDTPLFRSAAEVKAFQFLADHAQVGEVVLASYATSNPLPAWAPLHTMIGHGPESVNGPELTKRVDCFFDTICTDAERIKLLNEFRVHYVIWGPEERALGNWDLSQAAYLQPIYEDGAYRIAKYSPSAVE